MEQGMFFSALSTSLLMSIGQAGLIYVAVKILLGSSPTLSAEKRFRLLYSAMLIIFAGFIITLIRSYGSELVRAEETSSRLYPFTNYLGQPSDSSSFSASFEASKWIAGFYFTGILIQAILILAGLYQLSVFRTKSKLWTDKGWDERIKVLSTKLNINVKVELHLAERVFSPFTAGFLKPIIIFPIAMLNRLSAEQVEAILLHELAHVKRNDYILNILHKIIETTLYFNPFMWLISKEIRKEREFACDDLVMLYTKDTNQYARALVHIAEANLRHCSFGIAATDTNKFNLLNRIKRLKNMKTQQKYPNLGLLLFVSLIIGFVSLACIIPTETSIPKPVKNEREVDRNNRFVRVSPNGSVKPQVLRPLHKLTKIDVVLKSLPALSADTDTNRVNEYFKSVEWQKQMDEIKSHVAEIKKQFESPEWKKQMLDMQINGEEMKKHFDSPEWKKHMKDMKAHSEEMKKHFESPEWKKELQELSTHALSMQKEFESPEWKKKIEEIKSNALEMKKQFDTPEWKKQIEDMKLNAEEISKKFESPEWKKQIEEIKNMSLKLKLEAEKEAKKTTKPSN